MPITPVSYTPRPFVSGTSIGELMRLRGSHQADAELRRGELQARLWSDLGQTIAGGIQNYTKERAEAPIRKQEAELRAVNLQNARTQQAEDQRTIRGRDTENALAPFALKVGEDGVTTYDGDLLTRELTTAGFADRVPGVMKRLNEFQTSAAQFKKLQGELQATRVESLSNLAMTALEAGGTVTAARHALELVEPNGLLSKADAEKALGGVADDEAMKAKLLEIAMQSPAIRQEIESRRARRAVEAQTKATQDATAAAREESAKPPSQREYEYAKTQGYAGTYDQYQTMDANRKRPLSITTGATDDQMVADAARNILANPRDLTSIRTITSLRGDQRLKLFNKLKELNPEFNVGNIDRQVKFLDSYEDPKGRAAINRSSMNNILMHAADLSAANQQYRRTNARITNTPLAALAKQSGTAWSQFMTPVSVLKDEIALYFAGGYAPTSDQQRTWDSIVNDKATPAQIEQFAKDIIHVGLRRADTANQAFKTMMGYDDPNLITPDAVQAARALGLGAAVKKYGSGGQIGTAPKATGPVATTPAGVTKANNPY